MNLEQLRYPIGPWESPKEQPTATQVTAWINDIASFPQRLEALVVGLESELNWPYRPDGWTIKQVVHHCGDSHLNAWTRFKLALTEDRPTIRPYKEWLWAQTIDGNDDDISDSLMLIKALHSKLTKLLRSLDDDQLKREYYHPEQEKTFDLARVISNYAWHCNHHLEHIKQALALKL